MAFSDMGSREKTIIAVLGVIIVIALVGIGVLVAKLATDRLGGGSATGTALAAAAPQATFTLVATASLEGLAETTPAAPGGKPVVVVQKEALAPGLPAIVANEELHAGHRYRLEVTAADGSKAQISGSWSQSARNAAGKVEMDVSQPIEGKTPFSLDIDSPVSKPTSWSLSASVGPKDLLADNPVLVLTLWDITGQ